MLVILTSPAVAIAQTDKTVSVAVAACGELIDAVNASPTKPPRLSDPGTQKLFRLVLPEIAASGPPAGVGEFATLSELSLQAGRLARAYILAGTGVGEGTAESDPLSPRQREWARGNFLTFLPEIAMAYDFRIRVAARLAAGAAEFNERAAQKANQDPAVRGGLKAIASEVETIIAAALSLVADDNIEDHWRLERMDLLSRNAPSYAAFLDTKPSQILADQALSAAIHENNPAIGKLLKEFALAILR